MTSGAPASDEITPPARLRRRGDFVRATKSGARVSSALFTLQMARRDEALDAAPRFGFTVTKKVGNAVVRNRIRRRLKEALRVRSRPARMPLADACADIAPAPSPLGAEPGRDYVFVARRAVLAADFADIVTQMTEGLARLTRGAARSRNHKNRPSAS